MIRPEYVDGFELKIKELLQDKEALKAQVKQLREFAELIVEWKEYGFEKAKTLLDATPAQCLAEIKAQAVEDAASELSNLITAPAGMYSNAVIKLNLIAKSIRQEGGL